MYFIIIRSLATKKEGREKTKKGKLQQQKRKLICITQGNKINQVNSVHLII